jgi:hypothetical protein
MRNFADVICGALFLCSIPAENDKNANISPLFAVDSRFDGK